MNSDHYTDSDTEIGIFRENYAITMAADGLAPCDSMARTTTMLTT